MGGYLAVCIFFGIVGSIWYDKRHPVEEGAEESKAEEPEAEAKPEPEEGEQA